MGLVKGYGLGLGLALGLGVRFRVRVITVWICETPSRVTVLVGTGEQRVTDSGTACWICHSRMFSILEVVPNFLLVTS